MDNYKRDKIRFLIIGTGRSGSSLLASILAASGGKFGIPLKTSWDRTSGAYEHPAILTAQKWYFLKKKMRRHFIADKLTGRFCATQMNKQLSAAMETVDFAKSSNLIWITHHIYRLGYMPRIIVSYRPFEEFAASRYLKSGISLPQLIDTYTSVYSTALLQLQLFGGCAVGYDEVMNSEDSEWANALSSLTGIDQNKILECRGRLIEKRNKRNIMASSVFAYENVQLIYSALKELKGRLLQPQA